MDNGGKTRESLELPNAAPIESLQMDAETFRTASRVTPLSIPAEKRKSFAAAAFGRIAFSVRHALLGTLPARRPGPLPSQAWARCDAAFGA